MSSKTIGFLQNFKKMFAGAELYLFQDDHLPSGDLMLLVIL
jgi:hypothetical protein